MIIIIIWGGVDITNQLHAEYVSQRPTFRTWWPLFYWIIDTATVNAYQMHCVLREERSLPIISQLEFQKKLYLQLFGFSEAPDNPQKIRNTTGFPSCRHDTAATHYLVQGPKGYRKRCVWCVYKWKKQKEVSNAPRAVESPKTGWFCSVCKVPLCHDHTGQLCRRDFHNINVPI